MYRSVFGRDRKETCGRAGVRSRETGAQHGEIRAEQVARSGEAEQRDKKGEYVGHTFMDRIVLPPGDYPPTFDDGIRIVAQRVPDTFFISRR
jgi:hypothetical protein